MLCLIQTDGFLFSQPEHPEIIPISWGLLFLYQATKVRGIGVSLEYLCLSMIMYTFNSSTMEAEAGGFL